MIWNDSTNLYPDNIPDVWYIENFLGWRFISYSPYKFTENDTIIFGEVFFGYDIEIDSFFINYYGYNSYLGKEIYQRNIQKILYLEY